MDTPGHRTAEAVAGPASPVAEAPAGNDPGSQMRLAMPVVADQGGRLGTLAAWHLDPLTRRMAGLTIRHGFLGRRHTRVSMEDMTRVSGGELVLAHSRAAFKLLPGCDAPWPQGQNASK